MKLCQNLISSLHNVKIMKTQKYNRKTNKQNKHFCNKLYNRKKLWIILINLIIVNIILIELVITLILHTVKLAAEFVWKLWNNKLEIARLLTCLILMILKDSLKKSRVKRQITCLYKILIVKMKKNMHKLMQIHLKFDMYE